MEITLVAAMDQRRVIGRTSGGGIPWKLPVEAALFRDYCRGKVVLVGRVTYLEMIGWFERVGAHPLVLSTKKLSERICTIGHPAEIPEAAYAIHPDCREVVVAGGGRTYAATLSMATRMLLTEVRGSFQGDVNFPEFEEQDWTVVRKTHYPRNLENSSGFTVIERVRSLHSPH